MALTEREILERLRDAVVALKDVRAQRDALLQQKSEPIAIIGMACRFPGDSNTPESYFDLLVNGVDSITAVPEDRWPIDSRIGEDSRLQGTRWGAFVKNADLFDAAFFGISPREAERLDPQQRFLLEAAWEALERSGIVPSSLAGSKTGVFVGILNTDYYFMNLSLPWEQHDAYSATGNGHCFPAGRLSYTFGFQGPAISVDTACSSSLVAAHLACQSLRSRECDIALVGGVNHMLHPLMTELIAKTGALAPDGRCKSFDALANGYVRGEGCGVIVLKRLSDAQRDGDPITAVIRGSAVNQDGRSTGLTTPNVLSQEAMLAQALASARLTAEDIGYIEAHGTGTPLGDPIEMDALHAVFGEKRANGTRCWIGTVKTNIGHLEAAAGVAGLIKAALALQQEKIPPNLHFNTLNPRISLRGTDMGIATELIAWPRRDKPRRAGVSSFGMSGTNAHVILEEAPQTIAKVQPEERSAYLLPLSAKTPEALAMLVKSFADWFGATTNIAIEDTILTACIRREHHDYRIAAIARNREEFSRLLSAFASDPTSPGIVQGNAGEQSVPKIAFIFPGQGSQWLGMGRDLLAEETIFRKAIEACEPFVQAEAGFSILEQLQGDETKSRLSEIDVVQPLLFGFEVALAALWQSWGITPDYVVGHSMGEVAAAYVAGMLTLEDAVKVICRRSRLMRRLSGQGAMALVELPMAEAEVAIAPYAKSLSAAVSNGPRTTVLSGDPTTLEKVITELEARGVFCRRVKVDVASHSPQVDVLHDELIDALRDLHPTSGKIQMVSTITGETLQGDHLSAHYWWNNLRQSVRFSHVTQELMRAHFTIFLELSPHPILLSALNETLHDVPRGGMALASLVRQAPQRHALLESLGKMWAHGVRVDWNKVAPSGNHVPTMPTYPWQRKRYWIENVKFRPEITPAKISINDWLFTLKWEIAPPDEPTNAPRQELGAWLVFMDSGHVGKNLLVRLRSRGATCIRVDMGPAYVKHSPLHYCIDIANQADYVTLLHDVLESGNGCRGVVHLVNLDAPSWDDTTVDTLSRGWQHQGFLSALYLTQALVREQKNPMPRLWLLSQDAVAVKSSDVIQSVAQAPLWGLGRTIMLEHPELRCVCVDLDGAPTFDTIATLVEQLERNDSEEQIAFRTDGRFVARLNRTRMEEASKTDFEIKSDASYLITGGLGGLGLSVAQWMVNAGARHIALMGRKSPTDQAQLAIREMERNGAKVLLLQCDVSDPNNVLNALCLLGAEMPELRGVVHAAGVLDDRTLLGLSEENIREVFAPKILGAWNLHTFTSTQKLDFFVLYSSGAALLGSSGQANYAAANAFLDALAHARQARGLPAMSIQWGAFGDVGLAAKHDNRGARLENDGLAAFSTTDGTQALHQLLQQPRAEIGVLRLNVSQWLERFPELTKRPFWANLTLTSDKIKPEKPTPKHGDDIPQNEADLSTKLATASPADRAQMLVNHVRTQFGKVLRMELDTIDVSEKISHYGVDSLMAIELRNRLQSSLKIQFSVTEIWTHGSVAALAAWLGDKVASKSGDPAVIPTGSPITQAHTIAEKTNSEQGQWIVIPRPLPEAKMRLFCFPYAGGGAPVFSSWPEKLPTDIEVCAIEPPGRHARINEPLPQSVDEMVAAIIPAMLPYLDQPFAMFGHCLGAIVMFEVARRLRAVHKKAPLQLFASAAPSPHQYLVPNVAARSDGDFLDLLRAIGLAQKEVLDDPDIVRTMIPMVRADFELAAKYEYKIQSQMDVPVTTFAADADSFAPPHVVEQWSQETSSFSSKHTYTGGHYFLVPERDTMLRVIGSEMAYRFAALRHKESRVEPIHPITKHLSEKNPRLRLICFPGLGGSVADFEPLAQVLPKDVEISAVEFPGHGLRKDELALGRIDDIVAHVLPALQRVLDGPSIFLGHDLGALVMYEVTQRLQLAASHEPRTLIAIGAMAPNIHYFAPLQHLPFDNFRTTLRLFGVSFNADQTPVQTMQANCAAMTSYRSGSFKTLKSSIIAIAGMKDALVSTSSVAAWQQQTTSNFELHRLPLGHSELRSSPSAAAIIRKAVETLLRSPRA